MYNAQKNTHTHTEMDEKQKQNIRGKYIYKKRGKSIPKQFLSLNNEVIVLSAPRLSKQRKKFCSPPWR